MTQVVSEAPWGWSGLVSQARASANLAMPSGVRSVEKPGSERSKVEGAITHLDTEGVLTLDAAAHGPLTEMLRYVAVTPVGALERLEAVLACREAIELNVKPRIAVEAMTVALRLP